MHLSLSITITMCGYMAVVAVCYVVHTGYIIEDKKDERKGTHGLSVVHHRAVSHEQTVSLHIATSLVFGRYRLYSIYIWEKKK